jgi:hypothetical protein
MYFASAVAELQSCWPANILRLITNIIKKYNLMEYEAFKA